MSNGELDDVIYINKKCSVCKCFFDCEFTLMDIEYCDNRQMGYDGIRQYDDTDYENVNNILIPEEHNSVMANLNIDNLFKSCKYNFDWKDFVNTHPEFFNKLSHLKSTKIILSNL